MGYPDQQFLFVERFRYEVVGPGFEPRTTSDVAFSAVRKMIGMSLVSGFSFNFSATSNPVQTGHHDISRIRSGFSVSTADSACRPSFAVAIW